MLYGMLATTLLAAGNSSSRASPLNKLRRGSGPKRCWSPATRSRSSSTAATDSTAEASSRSVSAPRPGPTSNTRSPGPNSAAATIRWSTDSSTNQCWPKRLRARWAAKLMGSAGLASASFPRLPPTHPSGSRSQRTGRLEGGNGTRATTSTNKTTLRKSFMCVPRRSLVGAKAAPQ